MHRQFCSTHPAERPAARPGSRICAGVLYRYFVSQRVEIHPREPLDQPKLIGVRQPAIGEPEVFVEPAGIDLERLSAPLGDRPAVIQRVVIVAADLSEMGPAVQVNDTKVSVPAANQYEDSLPLRILDELEAEGLL